jgi:hypothetical protein
MRALGWPAGLLPELLFMVGVTALVWIPATLLTAPVDRATLQAFHARVRPPGWWGPVTGAQARAGASEWRRPLVQWAVGSVALLATTIGPIQLMVGPRLVGLGWTLAGLTAWALLFLTLRPQEK